MAAASHIEDAAPALQSGRSQWQAEQDKRSLGQVGNGNCLSTAFFGSRPVAGSRIEKDDPDGE